MLLVHCCHCCHYFLAGFSWTRDTRNSLTVMKSGGLVVGRVHAWTKCAVQTSPLRTIPPQRKKNNIELFNYRRLFVQIWHYIIIMSPSLSFRLVHARALLFFIYVLVNFYFNFYSFANQISVHIKCVCKQSRACALQSFFVFFLAAFLWVLIKRLLKICMYNYDCLIASENSIFRLTNR